MVPAAVEPLTALPATDFPQIISACSLSRDTSGWLSAAVAPPEVAPPTAQEEGGTRAAPAADIATSRAPPKSDGGRVEGGAEEAHEALGADRRHYIIISRWPYRRRLQSMACLCSAAPGAPAATGGAGG